MNAEHIRLSTRAPVGTFERAGCIVRRKSLVEPGTMYCGTGREWKRQARVLNVIHRTPFIQHYPARVGGCFLRLGAAGGN